jgi:predicted ATPase
MIVRIKIDGFKSLLDTELYLGPFTCIAGANAVGKSNFFDALQFLSKLADNTIIEAAKSIRSEDKKHSDIKDIFFKSGDKFYPKMYFEVDLLVAQKAEDDLGQQAEAAITSLRYILELQLNENEHARELIEIVREELLPLNQTETKQSIYFTHHNAWLKSVIFGRRSARTPFISTVGGKIKLHSDTKEKKRGGRTTEFIPEKMPRTLLSTVTSESPTAFMVRHEMRNWLMLQLEPSALREPNSTYDVKNAEINANGGNLPATLYRLRSERPEEDVYQRLTNQMKELVTDIDEVKIDNDEKRNLLTLQVRFKDGLTLPAQSLSDGTLRFMGLAILKEDNKGNALICMEEPENGIHPKKIKAILKLLESMATDPQYPVDADNPLRQVIINSHSPLLVQEVAEEDLYIAKESEKLLQYFNKKVKYSRFAALDNTWRTDNKLAEVTALGSIFDYVGLANTSEITNTTHKRKTVKETIDQQLSIKF